MTCQSLKINCFFTILRSSWTTARERFINTLLLSNWLECHNLRFLSFFVKAAIVFTDGEQTRRIRFTLLWWASYGLKKKGIDVFAVGIGNRYSMHELIDIISSFENVYHVNSFGTLHASTDKLVHQLCLLKLDGKSLVSVYQFSCNGKHLLQLTAKA